MVRCHRQSITDLLSLFFGGANEIDVLNAPITIPSPAGADEDMLTESSILSLSTPNYGTTLVAVTKAIGLRLTVEPTQ